MLVTGASGFVGSHCVVALLNAGYRVRTSVRSRARGADVRDMVARGGAEPGDTLTVTVADLTSYDGWPEAVDGCDYGLHVASPFPPDEPSNANKVIVPAGLRHLSCAPRGTQRQTGRSHIRSPRPARPNSNIVETTPTSALKLSAAALAGLRIGTSRWSTAEWPTMSILPPVFVRGSGR